MTFYSEEHEAYRATAREFVQQHVLPLDGRHDRGGGGLLAAALLPARDGRRGVKRPLASGLAKRDPELGTPERSRRRSR